jgi:hypothetical protein
MELLSDEFSDLAKIGSEVVDTSSGALECIE